MRAYIAFLKKEFMEITRNGKLITLCIVFILFGIMNPAIAKLTPALLKMASESMAETGIIVGDVVIDDMTSWTQFYKNIPMALIIFLVMFSGIITAEYQKNTIVPILTKGMSPVVVFWSKYTTVLLSWTAGYAVTFFITYFYNEYYWGNEVTKNIVFSALCVYVLGVFFLSVMMFMGTVCESSTLVIAAIVIVFILFYMLGMIPDINAYLPTKLMGTNELMVGKLAPSDYTVSMVAALTLSFVCAAASCITIRRKAV